MKYTKYIAFIMLLILLGINETYAETCYYSTYDNRVLVTYDTSKQKFTIEKRDTNTNLGGEPLINNSNSRKKDFEDKTTGITVSLIDGQKCPAYIVYRHNSNFFGSDGIFGFNDILSANEFRDASNQIKTKIKAWSLSPTNVTKDEFEEMKNDNSSYNMDISCNGIFGDKDDPKSLKYLINEIMMYPKIIVPILVIGFGTLDFAKAVAASKEDDIKKAQATFIKRVLIGITVFFVPLIMNIIMYLADIVWNGTFNTCGL